jgi:hypothetical protein
VQEHAMLERERFSRAARAIKQLIRHHDLSVAELNEVLWELVERKLEQKTSKVANDTEPPENGSSHAA